MSLLDLPNDLLLSTVACKIDFRPVHFRNSRRTVSLQFLAFVYAASGLASKCPAFWPGCLGAVPSGEGKRTARNLGAVYCVVGDVSFGVVRFLGSCFVVRGFMGWRVAVCTHTATF